MLKRFLVAAGLWLGLTCAALAQSTSIIGGGLFGDGKKPIVFSLAVTDWEAEASGGTTISYSACVNGVSTCNLGAADPNRIIVVCAGARMVTANTVSSVTIAGVSATLVASTVAQFGGTNGVNSACYQAAVPTGTTGTISVTWGAAAARTGIGIYRVVTGTTTANSTDGQSSGTTVTCSLTIAAGGKGIGFGFGQGAYAASWSNATQDFSVQPAGSSTATGATVSTTSAAISPTGVSGAQVLSCAAWKP